MNFRYQVPDLSFIKQAGSQFASGVMATGEAIDKKKERDTLLARTAVDYQTAETARKSRVKTAIDQYKAAMGVTEVDPRIEAGIEARFYYPFTADEKTNASKGLSRLFDANEKYEAWLKTQKEQADKSAAATAARSVTQSQRVSDPAADLSVGPPEQITVPGATTQEQALSAYSDLSAAGKAPAQTADQLRQQPAIAALPKTPTVEPEKPLTAYQKWQMKVHDDEVKAKQIEDAVKRGADTAKDRDTNVKWALDRETDYLAGSKSATEKASRLKQAIIKLKSGKVLDVAEVSGLTDGPTDLETLQQEYDNANEMITKSKEAARKYGSMAKSIGKGSSVASAAQEYDAETAASALAVTKQKAGEVANPPSILPTVPAGIQPPAVAGMQQASKTYSNDLQVILNQLEPSTRLVIQRQIDDAKMKGLTDEDIVIRLKAKAKAR